MGDRINPFVTQSADSLPQTPPGFGGGPRGTGSIFQSNILVVELVQHSTNFPSLVHLFSCNAALPPFLEYAGCAELSVVF